jgi:small conductance mechanosensitive channel
VNIVAAIAIIIVGMIVARISNTVNRVMLARHIDATVADFLSALVRYGIIAFTLIAALGRVGCKPPPSLPFSVPPVWPLVWRCRARCQTWRQACCW